MSRLKSLLDENDDDVNKNDMFEVRLLNVPIPKNEEELLKGWQYYFSSLSLNNKNTNIYQKTNQELENFKICSKICEAQILSFKMRYQTR